MLVNCAAYQNGKKLGDISVEEIRKYIKQPDSFVWIALKDASVKELEQMQQQLNLHELAIEDARRGHKRPKIEEYNDSLFVVIHSVEIDKINHKIKVSEVAIFVGDGYILSTRTNNHEGFFNVRERCEREPEQLKQGPAFVLYALMDAIVDRYFPIIDTLESELETIEEKIFTKDSQRSNIEKLYRLKRKVMILKHVITPFVEAVGKLHGGRVPPSCINNEAYFRDVHFHLSRIDSSVDSIREAISVAMQVNLSMVSIEENETTKRLASWAAIFGVASAFLGVWGMNFEYMPELKWKYGYPVALSIVAILCLYMFYRFKKSRWL
jgi:magnesium transporter